MKIIKSSEVEKCITFQFEHSTSWERSFYTSGLATAEIDLVGKKIIIIDYAQSTGESKCPM